MQFRVFQDTLKFTPTCHFHPNFCLWDSVSGVSKTTLKLHQLLEGLVRLKKAVMLRFIVYHSKQTQIKVSKRERYVRQSPGETRHVLPSVHSQWSHMGYIPFSKQWCMTARVKYRQSGKLTWTFVSSVSTGGQFFLLCLGFRKYLTIFFSSVWYQILKPITEILFCSESV